MVTPMDGDSAIPPYAWIAWQLRDAIRAGAPGLGEAMPSESELAARYGVSRMTAGKVLGQLAAEGLIRRRRGAGSVVARQITWERVSAEPGTLISVRLPTVSERAVVNAPAFVPVISVKPPGSAERLYAADAVIIEATEPSEAGGRA
jgi:DNA-binding transcriptional regulator YhcF (GntR family)